MPPAKPQPKKATSQLTSCPGNKKIYKTPPKKHANGKKKSRGRNFGPQEVRSNDWITFQITFYSAKMDRRGCTSGVSGVYPFDIQRDMSLTGAGRGVKGRSNYGLMGRLQGLHSWFILLHFRDIWGGGTAQNSPKTSTLKRKELGDPTLSQVHVHRMPRKQTARLDFSFVLCLSLPVRKERYKQTLLENEMH